jgi:CBS domain containing-hemolysin-like protein
MRKTLLFCLCASLAIFACQKDRLSQSVQQQTSREQMLQSLKTEQERNFFASEYLSRSNPLLSAPAVQRGPTDSLVG